jgi:[acyl-carrier-protein] S-malonyltransferase
MVAVLGADEDAVLGLCERAAQGEVLVPANFNAPGQVVVSGSTRRVRAGAGRGRARGRQGDGPEGGRRVPQPADAAAADRMRVELDRVNFRPLATPVYSNVTAEPHGEASTIKDLLIRQIVAPVQWERTMRSLVGEDGAGGGARFVELAPGRTLAGLAKRINRRLPIESLATADTLK